MGQGAIPSQKNDRVRVNSSDTSPDYLESKIVSSDGSVTITTSNCDCSIDLSATPGGITETWTKITVDYTDFNQALGTITIEPTDFQAFPAGTVVTFIKTKHSVAFVGGTTSNSRLSVGYGSLTSTLKSVFTAPAAENGLQYSPSFTGAIMDQATTDNVNVTLWLTGDTGDNLTAGSCDIWIKTATLI